MLVIDVGVTHILVGANLMLGPVADRAPCNRGVLIESVGGIGCIPVHSICYTRPIARLVQIITYRPDRLWRLAALAVEGIIGAMNAGIGHACLETNGLE